MPTEDQTRGPEIPEDVRREMMRGAHYARQSHDDPPPKPTGPVPLRAYRLAGYLVGTDGAIRRRIPKPKGSKKDRRRLRKALAAAQQVTPHLADRSTP